MSGLNRRVLVVLGLAGTLTLPLAPAQAQSPPGPTISVAPADAAAGQQAGGDASESATDLAKKLQNPIGDLISVPFQNNINQDWNLITRTILPLVWSPSFQPGQSVPFGTAPTSFSVFLSPKNFTNGRLWGAGPAFVIIKMAGRSLPGC